MIDHRSYTHNLKREKNSGRNGIRNHNPLHNVGGLGKSVVVFRLFEKLRYSNES